MTLNSSKSYNENTQCKMKAIAILSQEEKTKATEDSPKLLVFSPSKSLLYTIPNFFKCAIPFVFRNKFIKDTVKWRRAIHLFSNVNIYIA